MLGSPELVSEVKSPSNTKQDLYDKAMTTLAGGGAGEFWIVDPNTTSVTVYSKTSGVHVYRSPLNVPVPLLGQNVSLQSLFDAA
ncbi:MAG: Uma2 family endonuclease [Candidatus Sulfopaludibacter sp.]|nr:Uma2 family endonuclease [Candidatus Sulfopaludibacter sp.]